MRISDWSSDVCSSDLFDGQTVRGTADKRKRLNGIHLMNAWSTDNRICLGQIKVDDKSNEIIAMPQLMDMLELKGTIVMADAINTQKVTAKKAIEIGRATSREKVTQ